MRILREAHKYVRAIYVSTTLCLAIHDGSTIEVSLKSNKQVHEKFTGQMDRCK